MATMSNPRRRGNFTDHAHPGSQSSNIRQHPLGTREDVQRDDYESPIAGLFTRAYARYHTAEERRAADGRSNSLEHQSQHFVELNQNDPDYLRAQGQARAGAEAFMQRRFELDAQEREDMLWGVPPPAATIANPLRGTSVQTYGFVARPGFHRQFYASAESTRTYPNPFHAQPIQPLEQVEVDGPNIIDLQRRPPPLSKEELQVDFACKICQEQKIDTITMPCMHAALCHFCAEVWRQRCYGQDGRFDRSLHTCVICRRLVKESKRFYLQ